jgi:NitT/TauT family transport system substrate-binding protein
MKRRTNMSKTTALTDRAVLSRRAFSALLGVGGIAAFGLGLTGCGDSKGSGGAAGGSGDFPLGKTQVQALGGGVCGAPAYIAKDKGFWADEGLDVELVSGTFAQQQSGLASGQFLGTNGDFQFFPAINEGLDLKVLTGLHEGCIKLVVPTDSPIKKVADLKGKKIGVDEIGGTPWAITSVALAEAGVDPSVEAGAVVWAPYDLSVLEEVTGSPDGPDAFAAWDPFGVIAVNSGKFRVLVDIGEDAPFAGRSCCFLYVSNDSLQNKHDQVKGLYAGWTKAEEWISANPDEAAKIITDGSAHEAYVASEDVAFIADLLGSYHYSKTHDAGHTKKAYDDVLYFAEKLKDTGYLPKDLDAKAFADKVWYDPSQL